MGSISRPDSLKTIILQLLCTGASSEVIRSRGYERGVNWGFIK